uniref:Uncharacterized protein n=1 Tax=Physcomitrium patens TaxID=3218 RepID=A0A2K1KM52_PHYPA|nr:hypothetical protein PHYPA_005753 [Physcomitrium patens]
MMNTVQNHIEKSPLAYVQARVFGRLYISIEMIYKSREVRAILLELTIYKVLEELALIVQV